jgi:two-component system chemotaxis response regulator CheY
MNATTREPAEILVIDDDSLALASTAAALDSAGHIVYQARDRMSALRIARIEALDLVVCDVNLGADSGLDLSRELRRLPGMQDVPVMFISRTQLPDIVRRSHEAGAAYYLRKPLDPEVLIDLVGKALWLPHLVQTRLSMHEPTTQAIPPPRKKVGARAAAVQGIRLPLA